MDVAIEFSVEADAILRFLKSRALNCKSERMLLTAIMRKLTLIKTNPFYGQPLSKRLIPKKYHVQNLYRVELPQFWRMVYTLKDGNIEIIAFVLDILDHKKYDKEFKYK